MRALLLSAAVGLFITPNPTKLTFHVGAKRTTVALAPHGTNLDLSSVAVNGQPIIFSDRPAVTVSRMYGGGVALRFWQHADRFYVTAASVTVTRARVTLRYRITR